MISRVESDVHRSHGLRGPLLHICELAFSNALWKSSSGSERRSVEAENWMSHASSAMVKGQKVVLVHMHSGHDLV